MLFFIYRDRNSRRDKLIYCYTYITFCSFKRSQDRKGYLLYIAQEKRDKMMVCHYQLWTGLMIHEPKKTKKRAQLERTQDNKDGISKKDKRSVYYQIGAFFFQECPFKKDCVASTIYLSLYKPRTSYLHTVLQSVRKPVIRKF